MKLDPEFNTYEDRDFNVFTLYKVLKDCVTVPTARIVIAQGHFLIDKNNS